MQTRPGEYMSIALKRAMVMLHFEVLDGVDLITRYGRTDRTVE